MLTRNLYRLDEVKAALSWCIKSRRVKEVAFWTQELIESELYDDIFETLTSTWIWFHGLAAIDWFCKYSTMLQSPDPVTEDEMMAFATTLASLPKDASVLALLTYGLADIEKEPDRVSPIKVSIKTESDLELTFLRACRQGKARLAFDLSRGLWSDKDRMLKLLTASKPHAIWEHLDLDTWAHRAFSVGFLCMHQPIRSTEIKIANDAIPLLAEWSTLKGRARRVYAIPQSSLYFITRRGRQKNTVSSRKEGWVTTLQALKGCPFWDTALESIVDDETKEAFYEKYFPDDIPDEWSLEDQKKSHGFGSLIGDETLSTGKFIRSWYYGMESCVAWVGVRDALRLMTKIEFELTGASLSDAIEAQYEGLDVDMSEWNLEPVTKRVLEIVV